VTGIDDGEWYAFGLADLHERAAAVLEFAGHVLVQDELDPGHERDIA
jgi:hypothetical protein